MIRVIADVIDVEAENTTLRAQLAEERGRHQEMEREMLARGEVVFADLNAQLTAARRLAKMEADVYRRTVEQLADVDEALELLRERFAALQMNLNTIEQIAQRLVKYADHMGHCDFEADRASATMGSPRCECGLAELLDAYQQQKP
jgi:chromosome segregation ATPase